VFARRSPRADAHPPRGAGQPGCATRSPVRRKSDDQQLRERSAVASTPPLWPRHSDETVNDSLRNIRMARAAVDRIFWEWTPRIGPAITPTRMPARSTAPVRSSGSYHKPLRLADPCRDAEVKRGNGPFQPSSTTSSRTSCRWISEYVELGACQLAAGRGAWRRTGPARSTPALGVDHEAQLARVRPRSGP
jgi:hypothetical protein